ncbi:hypothetical protein F5877DRAFT_73439 [Lentinula edodes]|nr:hypothetical protein F5877DRAFT_73439 [Lentinula edodes]
MYTEKYRPQDDISADVRLDKLAEDLPSGRKDEVATMIEQLQARRKALDNVEAREIEAENVEAGSSFTIEDYSDFDNDIKLETSPRTASKDVYLEVQGLSRCFQMTKLAVNKHRCLEMSANIDCGSLSNRCAHFYPTLLVHLHKWRMRPPETVDANIALTLDVFQSTTVFLSGISSFRTRYNFLKCNWPRIWLWLKALLKPLDAFKDALYAPDDHAIDTVSRCFSEAFYFLNSIASASRSTERELQELVAHLADDSEVVVVMAKSWVRAFTRQWPFAVYRPVTQFLVVFGRMIGGTPADLSFRAAVADVCPASNLLSTWLTAVEDFLSQTRLSSGSERQLAAVNRGMLLSATASLFQPLPTLDVIDFTLVQARKLWRWYIKISPVLNTSLENLCIISIYSLAKFFSLLISGGPQWTAKVLDFGLLRLVGKTLNWMQISLNSGRDRSISSVFEDILNTVLLHSIYRVVAKGICHHMRMAEFQNFETYLGAGQLRKVWSDLMSEIHSPNTCYTRSICFQKALETACSNLQCYASSVSILSFLIIICNVAVVVLLPSIVQNCVKGKTGKLGIRTPVRM